MKPLNKTPIKWSPNFAYAIGLLATDGNLSKDGRHIDFASKNKEQIITLLKCLAIKVKIAPKTSGSSTKKYFHAQWSDVNFYCFLQSIGIGPNKSKTISSIKIPDKYYFDFLRGHLDGDGTFYAFWDRRWKSSYMFYTAFNSASKKHIEWLQNIIFKLLNLKGHFSKSHSLFILRYAKSESLKLLKKIYHRENIPYLKRKRVKINRLLKTVGVKI